MSSLILFKTASGTFGTNVRVAEDAKVAAERIEAAHANGDTLVEFTRQNAPLFLCLSNLDGVSAR